MEAPWAQPAALSQAVPRGPSVRRGQVARGSTAGEGARPPRGGGVAWRGGRGASKGRGGPSAQLPEPLSPGSRGPAALSPPGSLRSQQFGSSPRSPPLKRPGSRLGAEPRAVPLGMPRYELALILKAMQRPETAAALKRTLEALMDRGAIVRNLENLGERALPYKISAHNQQHRRGG